MLYSDILFHGNMVFSERARVERQALIVAAFTAHQVLQPHVKNMPKWGQYIKQLGLSDEAAVSKEDLKREADQAMANATRAIEKLKGGNSASR